MSGRRYNRQNAVYDGNSTASASTSYKDKVMATLYNPFSIKNNQPKWPDGLASFSIGRKQQFASEIYGKDITLVLFPGSTNWLVGWNKKTDDFQILNTALNLNHGDRRTFQPRFRNVYVDPSRKYSWVFDTDNNHYSAWRGVSYAMKVRCCNTDDQNDGWFESFRISTNQFYKYWGVVAIWDEDEASLGTRKLDATYTGSTLEESKGIDVKHPVVHPGDVIPANRGGSPWNNVSLYQSLPTYATGKLKDIGDVMFMLNPEKDDNEFTKTRDVNADPEGVFEEEISTYSVAAGLDPKVEANRQLSTFTFSRLVVPMTRLNDPGGPDTNPVEAAHVPNFQNSFISDSFDTLVVKIHATSFSRILVHSVANVELLAGEYSPYAQFSTVAYSDKEGLDAYINYRQTKCKLSFHTTDQYRV